MLLLAEQVSAGKSGGFRTRLRNQLIGKVREEIMAAGAGKRVPEFSKTTR